jgi:DNA mismatch endonuclease (patch repair protein)
MPKSRIEFWSKKFEANISRDHRVRASLAAEGWHVMVVWECEVGTSDLESRLREFLGDSTLSAHPGKAPLSSSPRRLR